MNKHLRNIYILFFLLIVLVAVGFYLVLREFNSLATSLGNYQSTEIVNNRNANQEQTGSENSYKNERNENVSTSSENSAEENVASPKVVTINANVLFTVRASTLDGADIELPAMITKVSKNDLGKLSVNVKVFTDQTSATTSLDVSGFVEIFSVNSENIKANSVVGAFKRMPPHSSVEGVLEFIVNPAWDKIILEVGGSDNPEFYEFDFNNGSYKETTVG